MTQVNTVHQKPKIKVYNLCPKKRIVIGRSRSCQIAITKPEISSRHAVIFHEVDSFWIYDNGSANGTRINGHTIKEKHKLKFNDVIEIGTYNFKFICEYVTNVGESYYLEIYKRQKNKAATQKVDIDLLSGKKTPEKKEKKNPEGIKKKQSKKKEIKKKQNKKLSKKEKIQAKRKKRNRYLKKLGSGVSDKLKNSGLNRNTIVSSLTRVSIVSFLCHLALVYLLVKVVVDSEPKKELKDVAINLHEEDTILVFPDAPEAPEPELETESLGNPNLQDFQTVSSLPSSITEFSDNIQFSDLNTDIQRGVGKVKVGKGYNGTRDASFKKRVQKSNGLYNDLDIRLTLLWNGHNDLDLHALTPNYGSIYYAVKEAEGGTLDIDQNADRKVLDPVENIIWKKAVDGEYIISVVFYNANSKMKRTPFKVEFQIFDDVYYYRGFFLKDEVKKKVEIVKFACRNGKYLIHSSMNDRRNQSPEEGLDILE